MIRRRWPFFVSVALGLAGCGAETPPSTTAAALTQTRTSEVLVEPEDRAGGDREGVTGIDREGVAGTPSATHTTSEGPGASTAVSRPLLRLVRVSHARAEDGLGGEHADPRAIALDLDAERVPPRALDPVLHVGELTLRHYEHPRLGTLRFVLAEDALPNDGAPISVQYGDDDASRLALGTLFRASIVEAP